MPMNEEEKQKYIQAKLKFYSEQEKIEKYAFYANVTFISILTLIIVLLFSGCQTNQTLTKEDIESAAKIVTDYKKAEAEKEAAKAKQKEDALTQAYAVQTQKPADFEAVSSLRWADSGDECHIVQCYFGDGHDAELFRTAAALPVDFSCKFSAAKVEISKPASDDTAKMTSYPGDHMQGRRAFVCLFNTEGELVECQDWAESYELDNRWSGKGAVKGLVIHCKQGQAVSRTELTEVK